MKLPAAIVKTWNDIQLNFDALQKTVYPTERVIRGGIVGVSGAVGSGTGDFLAVRNAAGDYSITFSPAFSGPPTVVAMTSVAAVVFVKYFGATGPTAAGVRLAALTPGGVLTDSDLYFIAVGPR